MFTKIRNIINRIEWNCCARKFCSIGEHSFMGVGFSVKHPENISVGDYFNLWKGRSDSDVANLPWGRYWLYTEIDYRK